MGTLCRLGFCGQRRDDYAGTAQPVARELNDKDCTINWIIFSIFVYVSAQLLICFVVVRGMKNEQDYLLAGRKLRLPMITMTIFATWFGAESCIGAAGAIYDNGLTGGRADPFQQASRPILRTASSTHALAPRLRSIMLTSMNKSTPPPCAGRGGVLVVPPAFSATAASRAVTGVPRPGMALGEVDLAAEQVLHGADEPERRAGASELFLQGRVTVAKIHVEEDLISECRFRSFSPR